MRLASLAVPLLLAACTAAPVAEAPPPRPIGQPPVVRAPVLAATLAGVMGQGAPALEALFGRPSLDLQEGPARKLQFQNGACVADFYLYPPGQGSGQAIVTHVDARLPDGRDADAGACLAALSRR